MPYWFDGLPITSGRRYSPVAVALTVVVLMPKIPPKMLSTFAHDRHLVLVGAITGAGADANRRVAGEVAAAVRAERAGCPHRIAVLLRDVDRGRVGAGRVVGEVDRARERGRVGALCSLVCSRCHIDTSIANAAEPTSSTSINADQTSTTPRSSAPRRRDPASRPDAASRTQEVDGTGSSWNTDVADTVGVFVPPRNALKSPGMTSLCLIATCTTTLSYVPGWPFCAPEVPLVERPPSVGG